MVAGKNDEKLRRRTRKRRTRLQEEEDSQMRVDSKEFVPKMENQDMMQQFFERFKQGGGHEGQGMTASDFFNTMKQTE